MRLLVFYLAGAFLCFVCLLWVQRESLSREGYTHYTGKVYSWPEYLAMNAIGSLLAWHVIFVLWFLYCVRKLIKREKHDLGNS